MRLKLTLKRRGTATRDIHLTADVTTTIAEIAAHLERADPLGDSHPPDLDTTLRVEYPGRQQARLLNPLLAVHESGLRSGCTIEVTPVGARNAGDELYGRPAARVRVVAGPDAGNSFTLTAGVNVVGRDPAAEVQLTDPLTSRRHSTITVDSTTTIADLNSANGIEVDGRQVSRAILTPHSRIRIGDDELRLVPLADSGDGGSRDGRNAGSASEPSASRHGVAFSRSPRIEPAYRGACTSLPDPPQPVDRLRFPVLAVISPVVMGVVLYAATQQLLSLLFIALSPLIMLATWLDNRVQGRRKNRDATARFAESAGAARATLSNERDREIAARVAESPSTLDVVDAIRHRSSLLWTRKPEHSTFLEVRFGLGRLASRTTIAMPSRGSATVDDWQALTDIVDEFATVRDVPVIENFDRAGAIGVAGSSTIARDAARAIVTQLVGLHSPADLVVTAFGGGARQQEWAWLTWLPHVDSPHSPIRVDGLAADEGSASVLLDELEELIDSRRALGEGRGERVRSRLDETRHLDAAHSQAVERLPATPAILAIVTEGSPADRARMVAVAESGPDFGVFVLWMASDAASLPVVCRTFVEIDSSGRACVGFVRTGQRVQLDGVEGLDAIAALQTAQRLAPIDDSGAQVLDESDLPRRVALLDLFDERIASETDAVIQRWKRSDSLKRCWSAGAVRQSGGIRALVGQGPSEPFFLDLRAHGPHALVGGTTGSGKSEFLQTWIMGLATEYSPDRVTFLLIDYKGGSAFAECVGLPHTVGLVTDLTPHLVRRALTSLKAELHHREELLNRAGAKDLEALEQRSDADAPPVLIIVIDEFAALAAEVPEFVDGVVDVAQRGRSLGLHLVMATQRPAGVITESLRANTNLRVALRVADEADSTDILGVPAAAFFDPRTPGRAAAKLGPGRVSDFQTAFLGGRTDEWVTETGIEVADLAFGGGSGTEWRGPRAGQESGRAEGERASHAPGEARLRDIQRLAVTIAHAADRCGVDVPRRPWLDALPDVVDLASLPLADGSRIPVGLQDDPENQVQLPFSLTPDRDGNLAVIGTSGSGKTSLLRSVAVAASRAAGEHPLWLYGLDFAGGGLGIVEPLPTVGSIILGTDRERVSRLISTLGAVAADRSARFTEVKAATLSDYQRLTGRAEPRILIAIDGMGAFRTDYEFQSHGTLFDDFLKLVAGGRQVGITFAISADRVGALPTQLLANVQTTLVMRLASEAEYAQAGASSEVLADAPPGRALRGGREVHVAVPGGSIDVAAQSCEIERLADALHPHVMAAPAIERLPSAVRAESLPAIVDGKPVLGISDETLGPIGIDIGGLFVVTGPFGSGRSTTMRTIIRNVRASRPSAQFCLIVAGRSELRDATDWAATSNDSEEAAELALRLTERFAVASRIRDVEGGDPEVIIVVENVGDLEGLPADGAVARLIRLARRAGILVLAETDTVTGMSSWATQAELKTARAGILLQPDEGDGMSLFRVHLPRVTRAEFPVGRGILVTSGRLERVQVAFTDTPAAQIWGT